MTEDGKMYIIYVGEEMKIVEGKMTAEKPKQEQMNKTEVKYLRETCIKQTNNEHQTIIWR